MMKLTLYQHYKGRLYVAIDATPFQQSTNGAARTAHCAYYGFEAAEWNIRNTEEFSMFTRDADGAMVPRFRRITRPDEVVAHPGETVLTEDCEVMRVEIHNETVAELKLARDDGDWFPFIVDPTLARAMPIGAKFRLTLERIE